MNQSSLNSLVVSRWRRRVHQRNHHHLLLKAFSGQHLQIVCIRIRVLRLIDPTRLNHARAITISIVLNRTHTIHFITKILQIPSITITIVIVVAYKQLVCLLRILCLLDEIVEIIPMIKFVIVVEIRCFDLRLKLIILLTWLLNYRLFSIAKILIRRGKKRVLDGSIP